MRPTFISLLLIAATLTGCSTSYKYHSTKITVSEKNGKKQDYSLLSVRGDSAIVVLDWDEADLEPIPFSHAEVIKRYTIKNITRAGRGADGATVTICTLTGAVVGGVTASLLTPSQTPSNWLESVTGYQEKTNALTVVFGTLIGTFTGGFIGFLLPPSLELQMRNQKDIYFLRSISAYPEGEPEEMKYVK